MAEFKFWPTPEEQKPKEWKIEFPRDPDQCPDTGCPGRIEESLDAPGNGVCSCCSRPVTKDDYDKWTLYTE